MAGGPDDATLMLRYRDGDLRAFESLYTRHRGPLYRYFLRHARDPAVAGQLYAEVWARVVKARHSYEPRVRFPAYLYQIAHHCFVDHQRHQSRATGDESADKPAQPEAGPMSFRRVLETLPAQQREAFLLQQEAGLTVSEIGRITGASPADIRSRLGFAVQKLGQALAGGGR